MKEIQTPMLFRDEDQRIARERRHIDVLPTSVIDVAAADQRRSQGGQDDDSSRKQHSNFFPEISDLVYQLFLHDAKSVYDPFAGWGERGDGARRHGKQYFGVDINPAAIEYAKVNYDVENVLGNSLTIIPPAFDAVFTCPPYWGLEKYSGFGIEEAKTWAEFLQQLEVILLRTYNHAPVGARFCVVVGDWRAKNVYYDLSYQIEKMFDRFGAAPFDKVIVSRKNISKIKICIPQAVDLGYTVKVHEYLFVWRKA
jgi:DNA modification methylase